MTAYGLKDRRIENQKAWSDYWNTLFEKLENGNLGTTLGVIAFVVLALGYLHEFHGLLAGVPLFDRLLTGLYTNVSSELLSIVITVLILDRMQSRRQDRQELTRLKALLASNESVVTNIAIAELNAKDWLQDGSLKNSDLAYANFAGASLRKAQLQSTYLRGANFSGASLQKAQLQGASLGWANLQGANLTGANFYGIDLVRANLQSASLGGANLRSAAPGWANLEGADLTGAKLEGADLTGAKLEHANLYGIECNEETILPDGTNWTENTDWTQFGAVVIGDWDEWYVYLYQHDLLRQFLSWQNDTEYVETVQHLRDKGLIN